MDFMGKFNLHPINEKCIIVDIVTKQYVNQVFREKICLMFAPTYEFLMLQLDYYPLVSPAT